MTKIKKALLSRSLFRQCYILCLFACNISFIHFAAYVALVMMVIWGAFLVVYYEITKHTALKTRYGFWLIAFLLSSVITMLIHILDNAFLNFAFILHLAICFFIFYAVHTEKGLNFRRELYNIVRIIQPARLHNGRLGVLLSYADEKGLYRTIGLPPHQPNLDSVLSGSQQYFSAVVRFKRRFDFDYRLCALLCHLHDVRHRKQV